jgi:acetyl-CoA carboxylase carboxyl transferase subunit alpha
VPIITIIVGEGASGALGIGGDRVFMLENTWYSVISPIFYFMEKLGVQGTSC